MTEENLEEKNPEAEKTGGGMIAARFYSLSSQLTECEEAMMEFLRSPEFLGESDPEVLDRLFVLLGNACSTVAALASLLEDRKMQVYYRALQEMEKRVDRGAVAEWKREAADEAFAEMDEKCSGKRVPTERAPSWWCDMLSGLIDEIESKGGPSRSIKDRVLMHMSIWHAHVFGEGGLLSGVPWDEEGDEKRDDKRHV